VPPYVSVGDDDRLKGRCDVRVFEYRPIRHHDVLAGTFDGILVEVSIGQDDILFSCHIR
jgi:hypothetical protein